MISFLDLLDLFFFSLLLLYLFKDSIRIEMQTAYRLFGEEIHGIYGCFVLQRKVSHRNNRRLRCCRFFFDDDGGHSFLLILFLI